MGNILDAQPHQVAAAQLAVDTQVEEGEVALPPSDLQTDADLPDLLEREGTLLPGQLAPVPGNLTSCRSIAARFLEHSLSPLLC